MKRKKILKIIGVVVSVIVILALSFGVFFGLLKRNDKTTISAYADELYITETITNTYNVYAPASAFPITLYGYNGISKKYNRIF